MSDRVSGKPVETAFLESEHRFRDLVEGPIEGIMIHRDFKALFVNDAFATTFGFESPAEVLALDSILEMAPPHVQSRARVDAAIRLSGGDAPSAYEYEGLKKDGSSIWLANLVRVVAWQGEPAIQSSVIDITERKQMEQFIKLNEWNFHDVLEYVTQGVVMYDRSRRAVVWNHHYQEIFGYPDHMLYVGASNEVLARYLAERGDLGPGEPAALVEERMQIAWCGEVSRYELTLGGSKTYDVLVQPTDDGGLVSTYTDITARRQAEQDVRAALREAERANQAKTKFMATMSHEFRTPLAAIIGFSETMATQYFGALGSQKYVEYAGDIKASGEHLLRLINDILDLSAIESGKHQLFKERLNFPDVVAECNLLVAGEAARKRLDYCADVPDEFPPIIGDRRAIKQILLNILSNAIKFTPDGGKISLTATASAEGLIVIVSDTGCGIPAEQWTTSPNRL